MLCNDSKILPVRNFSSGSHPDAKNISGELYAEKYTKRPSHLQTMHYIVRSPGGIQEAETGEFPEYESTGLLGSNLSVFDP